MKQRMTIEVNEARLLQSSRKATLAMTHLGASVMVSGLILLIIVTLGPITQARELHAKILQAKLGRFYFDAGKEEDVWPGCKWRVFRDSVDTYKPVIEGEIAESYEGVSISDSMAGVPMQISASSVAVIEAADTALTLDDIIHFATKIDKIDKYTVSTLPPGVLDAAVPRFAESEYGSDFQHQEALSFKIDTFGREVFLFPASTVIESYEINDVSLMIGEISYSKSEFGTIFERHSCPAPHFVALIPNISRTVNRNALLTTALRYRIDTSQINNAFEFESVPQLSFLPGTHSYSAFTTDISKAKKLLKENRTVGASVSIDTYSPTLQSTSKFIRGTLAQAGYTTTTVGWNEPADLRLAILPIYSDSPWVALREVLTSISKDTVAKDRANQPVRLADQLLRDALATSDSTRRIQLLERVDRMLMEDIGAFPLFRPIIYVCAKEEIRGIKFDKDGRLDLRSIFRLKLPARSTQAGK